MTAARPRAPSSSRSRVWPRLPPGAAPARPPAASTNRRPRPHPAGVLQIAWRTTLHEHGLFEPSPEECAAGARGRAAGDRLARGGDRRRRARDRPRRLGHRRLGRRRQRGALRSGPWSGLPGRRRRQLLRRSIRPPAPSAGLTVARGRSSAAGDRRRARVRRDRRRSRGRARRRRPESGAGSTSARRPRASPSTATPAPASPGGHLLAGFADGYLVSLNGGTGEVVWARSLAAASDQFVDVDATPRHVATGARPSSRRPTRAASTRSTPRTAPCAGASASRAWAP